MAQPANDLPGPSNRPDPVEEVVQPRVEEPVDEVFQEHLQMFADLYGDGALEEEREEEGEIPRGGEDEVVLGGDAAFYVQLHLEEERELMVSFFRCLYRASKAYAEYQRRGKHK